MMDQDSSPEKLSLRQARDIHEITIEQLSSLSDISTSVIVRIENGGEGRKVRQETAEALAAALALNVAEIDWPNGLTHIGRPPHTGRQLSLKPDPATCDTCGIELPVSRICGNCS